MIDTHAAIIELTSAGMPPEQAEKVVRLLVRSVDDQLATKADLKVLRAEVIGAVALLLLAHLGAVYVLLPS